VRLLIASGVFHPDSGGPATYLYRLLPELQQRGHQVSVLTFGDAPVDGYPYSLTRIPRRNYPRRRFDYYRAAARLWPGHDLAFLQSLGLPLPLHIRPRIAKIVGDTAWERAMNKGWVPPDTDIDAFQCKRYGLPVEANKALRAYEARRLDYIITPSNYLRRMVLGWGVDAAQVTTIYNALDVNAMLTSRSEARAALGLPETPILLTVARLVPWKGIDLSLQAIARLPDVHFLVAGEGAQRPRLEALAAHLGLSERVSFLGRISHERTALYYRAADYTLLYSGYEGLSHVLLESLNLGTPVIASDKGGNPEAVQHGVNGLLVPYVDIEALAATLQEAIAPGRQAELAANAHLDLERFSWQTMVEQTIITLQSVLERA
jgi:glycosyltransferase involved in cell wall biosynthesis